MTQQRITDSLASLFTTSPVVFWHDVDAEFSSVVQALQLDGVQLVRLEMKALQTGESCCILRYSPKSASKPLDHPKTG